MNLNPLFHWSPASRYAQIKGEGLRPGSEPTVASARLDYVCLGTNPATAWNLSGAMNGWAEDIEEWDLWMVRLDEGDDIGVRPEYGPELKEILCYTAVLPEQLWWVGRRRRGGPA